MNPAPVAKPTTPFRMSICPRYWGMVIPMSSVWPCPRVGARPKAPGKGILEPELWWGQEPGHQNQNLGNKGNWGNGMEGSDQETRQPGVLGRGEGSAAETVGNATQDSRGLKSPGGGQEGPSHPLFFRGARLVGPWQAAAFLQ